MQRWLGFGAGGAHCADGDRCLLDTLRGLASAVFYFGPPIKVVERLEVDAFEELFEIVGPLLRGLALVHILELIDDLLKVLLVLRLFSL